LVLSSKDTILLIDEIENGIHYINLDKLREIILTISKQQNVQVFATTHSKECIESYARVAKKLEDKDITFIKMTRLEDGSIMAGVRDYDMLQYTMRDGHEVRGV
jgi:AAA15 family ATPase/GTPase